MTRSIPAANRKLFPSRTIYRAHKQRKKCGRGNNAFIKRQESGVISDQGREGQKDQGAVERKKDVAIALTVDLAKILPTLEGDLPQWLLPPVLRYQCPVLSLLISTIPIFLTSKKLRSNLPRPRDDSDNVPFLVVAKVISFSSDFFFTSH